MRAAAALALITASLAPCQSRTLSRGPHRIELGLERREGGSWRPIDPGLVLAQNDRVRFRFRANFDGYLYVTNYGTSGDYTQLFPRQDTGEENRIVAGRSYMVPATADGSFKVTGPAGHDVVYWMVTPAELGAKPGASKPYVPLPPPPKQDQAPLNMTPRCDDTILRARGDCVDGSAGPKTITEVPEHLAGLAGARPRELLFIRERNTAIVSSPSELKGPVVYEFHLAHK